MRNYRERLRVPASYWLLTLCSIAIIGSTLWAGFSVGVAIAIYAVLGGGCAAVLLNWGRISITVADGQLRAGRAALPLQDAGEVATVGGAPELVVIAGDGPGQIRRPSCSSGPILSSPSTSR